MGIHYRVVMDISQPTHIFNNRINEGFHGGRWLVHRLSQHYVPEKFNLVLLRVSSITGISTLDSGLLKTVFYIYFSFRTHR